MVRDLIIGYGEIGKGVRAAVTPEAHTHDITQGNERTGPVDVMHICFPYSETFVDDVRSYVTKFEPNHIIIWSTVPIGTTKKIKFAVHSPVEGRHPDLELSLRTMTRWVGANQVHEAQFFYEYFVDKGLKVKSVPDSNYTEALKLLSTAEYGINLVFADYKKEVADKIGMDYSLTKEWNKDYNKLYHELGEDRFQKFILDAPNSVIGGHCVIPNAVLLSEDYPDDLLDFITEMEKK